MALLAFGEFNMTISDELQSLNDLHQRGALSDDEFLRAKARVLGERSAPPVGGLVDRVNGLRRSTTDAWLGGVCAGLAQITGLAAWAWRLLFIGFALCGGAGVLAYALLWLLVPQGAQRPAIERATAGQGG